MLDTNTVSYIARSRSPRALLRLEEAVEASIICISVITEGEILYGLAKRPEAHQLARMVRRALSALTVMPWTSGAALAYGTLRAENERRGIAIGGLDMLIAAHAIAESAVLVTSDAAIARLVGGPEMANWADDVRSA